MQSVQCNLGRTQARRVHVRGPGQTPFPVARIDTLVITGNLSYMLYTQGKVVVHVAAENIACSPARLYNRLVQGWVVSEIWEGESSPEGRIAKPTTVVSGASVIAQCLSKPVDPRTERVRQPLSEG